MTGSTLQVRQVAYTDPLVLPMLAELDTRYGAHPFEKVLAATVAMEGARL